VEGPFEDHLAAL